MRCLRSLALAALLLTLLRLLQSIRVGVDVEHLAAMAEAVDEGDDAASARKHLVPFLQGTVGRDDGRRALVASGDDFEEHVGVAHAGRERNVRLAKRKAVTTRKQLLAASNQMRS